ncbi:MAG: Dynamin family protein [Phycisphaerae bacterium]|nr:Dynamin family protein [Phycisphaerae bacterium]
MAENTDRNQLDPTHAGVVQYPHGDDLNRTLHILKGLDSGFSAQINRLQELQTRLEKGRFHLAVLGQFKRGKSTFLNALLGEPLLPTAVLPLTAIPTFIVAGLPKRATVFFLEENKPCDEWTSENPQEISAFLSRFVTETQNSQNRLGVEKVEVQHSADLLKNGVVLIDTPGIGSTLQHNTEATLNFLPQCDAAVFLVSADPPLTEVEIRFLSEVKSKIPTLLFVLNKIDYLSEGDRQGMMEFLKSVLREQAGLEPTLFAVSARNGLAARAENDPERWRQSGMSSFQEYLIQFLAQGKAKALDSAISVKVSNIVNDALMQIQLIRRSLEMPLSELQRKIELFGGKLQEAAQERISISDILTGDKNRLMDSLETQLEGLQQNGESYLTSIVTQHRIVAGRKWNEQDAQNALADAVPAFFEREIGEYTRDIESRIEEVLKRRQRRLIEITESIRQTAARMFDIPYNALETEDFIPEVRQPVWMKYKWNSSLLPISPTWFDFLLPVLYRKRRIQKRTRRQIEYLASYNTGRIRGAMRDNIETAFRSFAREVEKRFDEIITATQQALKTALSKKNQQSESIQSEILKLKDATDQLSRMSHRLAPTDR